MRITSRAIEGFIILAIVGAIVAVVVAIACVTVRGDNTYSVTIRKEVANLTNLVFQQVPDVGSSNAFFTRYGPSNYAVGGPVVLQVLTGKTVRLSWQTQSNRVYWLLWSTNVDDEDDWHYFPIRFVGDGGVAYWYDTVNDSNRFYRGVIQSP